MNDQELKKFCLEIAVKMAANASTPTDSNDLVKEATILYNYLKL